MALLIHSFHFSDNHIDFDGEGLDGHTLNRELGAMPLLEEDWAARADVLLLAVASGYQNSVREINNKL